MFSVFQNMSTRTKIVFLWQKFKIYVILGYNNRQLVVMTAILNKKFPPLWFFFTLYQGIKWASK